jgi:predicted DNA-binding transcriptional regulator AlpA
MRYLNAQDLSTKLGGRSRSSIYRDVDAGRLPSPIKLGRRIYWLEEDVEIALIRLTKERP